MLVLPTLGSFFSGEGMGDTTGERGPVPFMDTNGDCNVEVTLSLVPLRPLFGSFRLILVGGGVRGDDDRGSTVFSCDCSAALSGVACKYSLV